MLVSAFFFSCIVIVAVALFFRGARRALMPITLGKPDDRVNNLRARFRHLLELTVLSKLRSRILIILCLLIALTAVIESFAEGLTEQFAPFHRMGRPYEVLTFLQEIANAVIVIAMIALIIRHLLAPRAPANRLRTPILLAMIMLIAATTVAVDAIRIAAGGAQAGWFYPISSAIAGLFPGMPPDPVLLHVVWWTHITLVLVFINMLAAPSNIHILASLPNIFFSKMETAGTLPPVHVNGDAGRDIGAVDADDLSWKTLLDAYSCTACGRCDDACPAHTAGMPLSPQKIITAIRVRADEHFRDAANGHAHPHTMKDHDGKPIVHGYISGEELWSCSTCMACVDSCPVSVEQVDAIVEFRRGLVNTGSDLPDDITEVFRRLEAYGSPYPEAATHSRMDWAEGLGIPTLADNARHEILFWVGCAGAFDARCRSVSSAFVRLLQLAGVRFAVLGDEERCTGDAARRLGNERLAAALMRRNIETLRRYRVKTIVTTCPHCFNTLKNEYPAYGGRFTVLHHSEYLDSLLRAGRLITTHASTEPYTYHDPCYLARGNGIIHEPRRILSTVSVARRIEMPRSKEQTVCCGSGGGRMWMDHRQGREPVAATLGAQARESACETIATACPFCLTSLSAELASAQPSSPYIIRDIAELLSSAIDDHVKISPHIHSK